MSMIHCVSCEGYVLIIDKYEMKNKIIKSMIGKQSPPPVGL